MSARTSRIRVREMFNKILATVRSTLFLRVSTTFERNVSSPDNGKVKRRGKYEDFRNHEQRWSSLDERSQQFPNA